MRWVGWTAALLPEAAALLRRPLLVATGADAPEPGVPRVEVGAEDVVHLGGVDGERLGAPGTTEISAENTMGRKVKTLQAQPETTE